MRNLGERFMRWLGWVPVEREEVLEKVAAEDKTNLSKAVRVALQQREQARRSWENAEARIAELEAENAALAAELALMVQTYGPPAEARRVQLQRVVQDMNERAARLTA